MFSDYKFMRKFRVICPQIKMVALNICVTQLISFEFFLKKNGLFCFNPIWVNF